MDWLPALKKAIEEGRASTLVTIADTRGSAPREAGVKMLVTATESLGTIGGGNLEHEAIRIARSMIERGARQNTLRQFALGPSLGQCCGGNTKLLFDPFPSAMAMPIWINELMDLARGTTPSVLVSPVEQDGVDKMVVKPGDPKAASDHLGDLNVDLAVVDQARAFFEGQRAISAKLWRSETGDLYFMEKNVESLGNILLIGAGHVGKALANVLSPLPFNLTWADNRPEQYPDDIHPSIHVQCTPHLEKAIDEAPANTIFLVMTYSHDLDYALCARVLAREDFRYLGLIGSKSKRAKFEKTMADLGIDQALVDRVVCPIGLPGIDSKQPSIIAVATAAELLALPPLQSG